jgi:hypothetical protein
VSENTSQPASPRALLPASGIPLLYFGFAHACLALAFGALIVRPSLAAGHFLHPQMVAVVHLVTLGWITGSILGAFYIVGPLALRLPLRPTWRDRAAFVSFATGVIGIVANFWIAEYRNMAWSALLVVAATMHVGIRAVSGLRTAVAPWPVKLHVALAFANILAASALGILIGLNRLTGWLPWSPISAAFAHAHFAGIGWAVMMAVGLSYRLVPMILPARMPTGSSMAISAILLEIGVLVLVIGLITGSAWSFAGALLVVGGLTSFVAHVRGIVKQRLPRPPALPHPDWATWQTHAAFAWLLTASVLGLLLAAPLRTPWPMPYRLVYGTFGLIGFLAQIVMGIQGRLLPMFAWYRAFEARGMQPPGRSAHALVHPALARIIFLTWMLGVPACAAGVYAASPVMIAAGSMLLLLGVLVNGAQAAMIVGAASRETG